MADILPILLINAAVLLTIMAGLWALSIRLGDVSFIDSFWAFGFVIVAWVTFLLADGAIERQLLLVGITTIWGVRLGGYLFYRWRKEGPDKRYVALLNKAGDKRHQTSLQKVFLLQGVLLWVVSLPIQLGQIPSAPETLGLFAYAGAALCLIGFAFETIGDWQLMKFKQDPANAGKALDTGLWRYTRHPNYFGDACIWWGLYMIAAETVLGRFSIVGPMLLTFLLVKWSGAALLERRLKRSRPEYADYIARTSAFIPMPPKRLR